MPTRTGGGWSAQQGVPPRPGVMESSSASGCSFHYELEPGGVFPCTGETRFASQWESEAPAACPGEAQEQCGDGLELNQPRRRERPSRRVSEIKAGLRGGQGDLTGCSAEELEPEHLQSTVELWSSPRPSPVSCIIACARGNPIPTGSSKQGWRNLPCTPSLLHREHCGGLLQSQASP